MTCTERLDDITNLLPYDSDTIKALRNYNILFILDSYDELDIPRVDIIKSLGLLQNWPKAKLLVTSRRILSLQEESEIFQSPQKCYLSPFRVEQMLNYLSTELYWDKPTQERYLTRLQRSSQLMTTLSNPFVLSLFVKAQARIRTEDFNQLTRYSIYYYFVENWLLQSQSQLSPSIIRQLRSLFKSYDSFASEVSYNLFVKGLLKGKASDIAIDSPWTNLEAEIQKHAQQDYLTSRTQSSGKQLISKEDYINLMKFRYRKLMQSAPLKLRKGEYDFMHKSLYEYFILRYIINILNIRNPHQAIRTLNIRSIQEEPAVFQFWYEFYKQSPNQQQYEDFLLSIVRMSRGRPAISQAASDAMTLCHMAEISFAREDFAGVNIPKAYLRGGIFHHTDFTGANLQGANLQDGFFHSTNFTRTNLEKVFIETEWEKTFNLRKIDKVVVSQNRKFVILGGREASAAYIYDSETKEIVQEFKAQGLDSIQISQDNKLIVLGGYATSAYIYDVESREIIHEFKVEELDSIQISQDNKLIVLGGFDAPSAYIYDAESREIMHEFKVKGLGSIQISQNNKLIVLGGVNATVAYIYDVESREIMHEFKENAFGSIQISQNNKLIVLSGATTSAYIYDVESREIMHEFKMRGLGSIQISQNNKLIVLGGFSSSAYIYDAESKEIIHEFKVEEFEGLKSIQISQNNKLIVLGGEDAKSAYIYDAELRKIMHEFKVEKLDSIQISQNNKLIVLGGEWAPSAYIYDVESREIMQEFKAQGLESIQISQDNKLIVLGGSRATSAYIYDTELKITQEFKTKNIDEIQILKDNKLVMLRSDPAMKHEPIKFLPISNFRKMILIVVKLL